MRTHRISRNNHDQTRIRRLRKELHKQVHGDTATQGPGCSPYNEAGEQLQWRRGATSKLLGMGQTTSINMANIDGNT